MNALCLSKDEERLQLLKEVAGTRVYEERREESSAIIAETNSKRDKIQEVITYIEERLEELEGEKEELSAYQKCDRDKRAIEYTIYDKELRKAREQIDSLESQRSEDAATVHELHERSRATQDDIGAQKKALAEAEAEVEKLAAERTVAEAERSKLVAARARLEVEVKENEERCANDSESQEKLQAEAAALEKEVAAAQAELATHQQPCFDKAKAAKSSADEGLAAVELEMNELLAKQGRGQRFTTAKDRDAFLNEQLKGLGASIVAKEAGVAKLVQRIADANAERKALRKAVAAKEVEQKKRQAEMAACGEAVAALTEKRHALAEERKARWQAKQDVDDEVKKWRDVLQGHERDFRACMPKHIAQGLEAVERIVEEGQIKGYYGPLVENFTLTNPKYRVPVEVAANNALFNVVVEDDDVASALIKKLTKDNLGRLTFMPLKQLSSQALTYPQSSDVHPLMKVALRFNPKMEKAMSQVFGKKLIARDFDTARQFATECNMDAITMEGDEVNRKGALEGGFHDERRSRLAAHAGIAEARLKLAEAVARQGGVEKASMEVDGAVSHVMGEIQREEAKRANTRMVGGQAGLELKQCGEDLLRLEDRLLKDEAEALPAARAELAALEAQATSFRAELGTTLAQTLSADERATLARLKASVAKLTASAKAAAAAFDEAAEDRQRLVSLLKDNLLKRVSEVKEQLSSAGGDGLGGDADVEERKVGLAQKKAELGLVSREAEECSEGLRKRDKATAAAKEARRLCKKRLGDLKAQEAADAEALAEVEKQTEKQLNKRSMLVQKREENLRKIQQLGSLPAAELDEHSGDSVKELMKKLHKVNQGLTKYSHVNKKALDQYVNFSEQREGLLERKKELDKGASAIEELIVALDRQKDEAILRTFKGVSKHFGEVFKELVPQGRGQLIMRTSADREDAAGGGGADDDEGGGGGSASLSSQASSVSASGGGGPKVVDFEGVQVRVSFTPNGEVFLMSQLSGGQKALVALSMIFAIQRCDPAPFYLFDELDQALDSTYRASVAAMIQRQANAAQPTQFITTTFRPELVKVASKCYGISLQNKNSNIHALSKGDALSFVADLMNEEEAVGTASAAPLPRKRLQADEPVPEEDEEEDEEEEEEDDEDAGKSSLRRGKSPSRSASRSRSSRKAKDDDEEGGEDDDDEEEGEAAAPVASAKRKGRR